MASKTIPARTIVTCDWCGVETNDGLGEGRRRMKAVLSIACHALDHLGDPAADGSRTWDLCDACASAAFEAINAASRTRIRDVRERNPEDVVEEREDADPSAGRQCAVCRRLYVFPPSDDPGICSDCADTPEGLEYVLDGLAVERAARERERLDIARWLRSHVAIRWAGNQLRPAPGSWFGVLERAASILAERPTCDHPFPWRIEQDWTHEIRDGDGRVVVKVLEAAATDQQRAVVRAVGEEGRQPAEGRTEIGTITGTNERTHEAFVRLRGVDLRSQSLLGRKVALLGPEEADEADRV